MSAASTGEEEPRTLKDARSRGKGCAHAHARIHALTRTHAHCKLKLQTVRRADRWHDSWRAMEELYAAKKVKRDASVRTKWDS